MCIETIILSLLLLHHFLNFMYIFLAFTLTVASDVILFASLTILVHSIILSICVLPCFLENIAALSEAPKSKEFFSIFVADVLRLV